MHSGYALLLFAGSIMGGLGLLAWSWFARGRRNRLGGIKEVLLSNPWSSGTVGVSGVAVVPEPLASPVTNTPCVFYEKQVDIQRTFSPDGEDAATAGLAVGLTLAGKLAWMRESVEHVGGFFIVDGGAKAFVLPQGARLHIGGEQVNSVQDPGVEVTRRVTERFIAPGRTVCVIGKPRRLEEAFSALQRSLNMPPETLRRLSEEGPMPCFFDDGSGTFTVADMAFSDLRADAAESADSLFWAGLAMLGIGVFIAVAFVLGLV